MERSKYELTEKGHVEGCPCCTDETMRKLRRLIPADRQRNIDAKKASRKTIRARVD